MSQVVAWVVAHWAEIAGVIAALLTLASIVTALTPTPKDDEVVRKIASFLSFLQPRTSAGTLKPPFRSPAPEVAPAAQPPAVPFSRLGDRR